MSSGNVLSFPDPGGLGPTLAGVGLNTPLTGPSDQASSYTTYLDANGIALWWWNLIQRIFSVPQDVITTLTAKTAAALQAVIDAVTSGIQAAQNALEAALPGYGKFAPVLVVGVLALVAYLIFKK